MTITPYSEELCRRASFGVPIQFAKADVSTARPAASEEERTADEILDDMAHNPDVDNQDALIDALRFALAELSKRPATFRAVDEITRILNGEE